MMPRQMVQWRIYVYANSLYSLPELEVPDYRDWSPETYNHSSYDIHRIMNWVNRDVSVLLRVKSDVLALFEVILDMLPQVGMRSDQFKNSLVKYLGVKTNHFIHELINFARSPYENMIAYECNVQYKARREEDYDGPSTSAEARRLGQFMSPGLHNFVEFSRRINPDDCGGFEADLQLEDEDAEELDELLLERKHVSVMMLGADGRVVPSRGFVRHLASSAMGGSVPASVASSASLPAPVPVAASASVAESQLPLQQQSASDDFPSPGSHSAASSALANYELQLAIERSMRDEGFGFGAEWSMPPPSSARTMVFSNRQLARNVIAANLYRIASGPPGAPVTPIPVVATGGAGGGSGTSAGTGAAGGATRGAAAGAAAGGAAAGGAAAGGAAAGGAAAGGAAAGGAAGAAATAAAQNAAVRGRIRNRLRATRTHRR